VIEIVGVSISEQNAHGAMRTALAVDADRVVLVASETVPIADPQRTDIQGVATVRS
jgi:electron transfer flavoprotein alpha/beta subunit